MAVAEGSDKLLMGKQLSIIVFGSKDQSSVWDIDGWFRVLS